MIEYVVNTEEEQHYLEVFHEEDVILARLPLTAQQSKALQDAGAETV